MGLSLGLVARVLRRRVVDLELFGESGGERLSELIELINEGEDGGFGEMVGFWAPLVEL